MQLTGDAGPFMLGGAARLRGPLAFQRRHPWVGNDSGTVAVLNSLTAVLTLMLVAVAGLGVLNGVVLEPGNGSATWASTRPSE
ncbi:hypothetical protein GCM10010317_020550 [Streptomyces mirabilis]|nr:hypothetical protein GCM10010317_020550 [Streptomyces mirabilis]